MSRISENVSLALAEVVVSDLLGDYFVQPTPNRMIEDALYKVAPPGHLERNYTMRLYLKPSALTVSKWHRQGTLHHRHDLIPLRKACVGAP